MIATTTLEKARQDERAGTMRAVVQDRYGSYDALRVAQIDRPAPGAGEVLVRVRAAAVNIADWYLMTGLPLIARPTFGMPGPKVKVRGHDLAGVVETVGDGVTRFRRGDEVFGFGAGTFAEYSVALEADLAPKPANLSFEQAAAVPMAAMVALQALRDVAELKPGQSILINGAAGGIGTFAIQIARSLGAEVTAVCSTQNVAMVSSIGADHVVDYTKQDFTQSGERYDVIFDNVANRSVADLRRALKPGGTLVSNAGAGGRWIGPAGRVIKVNLTDRFVSQRLRTFLMKHSTEDLLTLKSLIEQGKVQTVIDRTVPLSDAPEAIRYVKAGHARGKVVIAI